MSSFQVLDDCFQNETSPCSFLQCVTIQKVTLLSLNFQCPLTGERFFCYFIYIGAVSAHYHMMLTTIKT